MGDSGTLFKIVYMSTEEVISKMTCFKIPGFNDAPVVPQGVLPNISLYEVCKAGGGGGGGRGGGGEVSSQLKRACLCAFLGMALISTHCIYPVAQIN